MKAESSKNFQNIKSITDPDMLNIQKIKHNIWLSRRPNKVKINYNDSEEMVKFKLGGLTIDDLTPKTLNEIFNPTKIYRKDRFPIFCKSRPTIVDEDAEDCNSNLKYGLFRLAIERTKYNRFYSSFQERFAKQNAYKIIDKNNLKKYLIVGVIPERLFQSKIHFLFALDGTYDYSNIPPYISRRGVHIPNLLNLKTKEYQNVVILKEDGDLCVYDANVFFNRISSIQPIHKILNTRNKFKTWYNAKSLPYLPEAAALMCSSTKHTNLS